MDKLDPPAQFNFPFEPYPIQDAFMRDIFRTIEERKVGLFESPTGTGKSLSIICGALTWLKEYKTGLEVRLRSVISHEKVLTKKSKTGNWLAIDYESSKESESYRSERLLLENLLQREIHWKRRREKLCLQRKDKEKEKDILQESLMSIGAVLKECQSGGDADLPDKDLLVEDFQVDEKFADLSKKDETEPETHVQKIYYATRTHSQVTQFISELKKSPFGMDTRVAALGSRQNLCIFEPVRKLKNLQIINERCIELQKGSSKKKSGDGAKKRTKRNPELESSCPYFSKDQIESLSSNILDEVKDIEDLTKAGIHQLACPYYASRSAVPDAEIVALPYNSLFHKATREASGISLKDQVIIIDEAHNILESIAGMYSCEITEVNTRKAFSQLQQYHDRYKSRLSAMNLLNIRQLLFALEKIQNIWRTSSEPEDTKAKVLNTDQFLILCGLEAVNLKDLLNYCGRSLIARKLMGFSERYPEITDGSASCNNPFMIIENFLEVLISVPEDGRIFVYNEKSGLKKAKFMLLNPAAFVKDVFTDARSVILAGGTMQPMADYENQLLFLSGVQPSRISKFSCGHVIQSDRVLPIVLQKGPGGSQFLFNYQNRTDEGMILQLLRVLLNISTIVPGGVVCFFPSYDYEEKIFQMLTKNVDLYRNIEKRKKIFREPKLSADVDTVLEMYSKCISNPAENRTGSILFAVVGGKLSEGINFSDNLGRCVIMVGMPYPNRTSVELQEKMNFLNKKLVKPAPGPSPGDTHYENLCMKAVNQSIGRAIRHKNDYAVILLVDTRYGNPNISRNLPKWIGGQLQICDQFQCAFSEIKKFFVRLHG